MINPVLIPIVVAPHVVVPAVMLYILHLDQQETVARVRQYQVEHRVSLEQIPPAPPMPKYDYPPIYENDNVSENKDMPKPRKTFDMELFDAWYNRYIRYMRMNESPMRNYIKHIGERPFKLKQRERDMRMYRCVLHPLYMFTSSQELCCRRMLLRRTHILIDMDSGNGYNCHSPLQQTFSGMDRQALICNAIYARYRINMCQPKETPMRDLCRDERFQAELSDACAAFNRMHFSRSVWRAVFHRYIAPKIPMQRGVVLSHMRRCILDSIWFAIMEYNEQIVRHEQFAYSPMHQLALNQQFKQHLVAYQQRKHDELRQRSRDHMWWVTLLEEHNIKRLADKKRFNREVNASPMHQFIQTRDSRFELCAIVAHRINRHVLEFSSPLRAFTCENKRAIILMAGDMHCTKHIKSVYRSWICDDLRKNYGALSRKYAMRAYRLENNIPEVTFDKDCANTAFIVFTPNKHLANQFLADSNLEDFDSTTIYWNKNNFQSYAYSHLGRGVCINDMTDAAQTFLNISHLTDENTKVQIHADTGKLCIPDGAQTQRYIWIYFVKRDLTEFSDSLFKTCSNRVRDYFRRMKDADVDVRVGCMDKWLSDKLVVRIESVNDPNVQFDNISRDIINTLNLVKGVIYAKRSDRVGWIHLPPIK